MVNKLKSMKLKQRLTFGYAIVICMMVISGIISVIGTGVLYSNLNRYIEGAQRTDTAVKLCRLSANVAARNIREMALNKNTSSYGQYEQNVSENLVQIDENLAIIKKAGIVNDGLLAEYETALHEWSAIGIEIVDEIKAGKRDQAIDAILNDCAPKFQTLVSIAERIDEYTDVEKTKVIQGSTVVAIMAIVATIGFIVVAVAVASGLSKMIVASIVHPLHEVEQLAGNLSEGNLQANITYRSDDEIGVVAESLQKSVQTISGYIADIAQGMEEFSNGNFDTHPQTEWKGDFVSIYDSIQRFQESMAKTVQGIQRVANQVTNGSEQVSASSIDLAQGATDQAGVTEELAATLESVSERVASNAEYTKNISKEVERVGLEIVNSDGKMREMVVSMREISEASREISKIIATINDIASQTNLLALNASIEAARAGEAGKGFAVVADQVSVLAAQSADAAKESTALIESSVKAVEKGMIIADETAEQLQNVVAGSQAIIADVNRVAAELGAQADSIYQVNQGVEQINDVVQTNSATSEECAAASQEMSEQAEALENLIAQFKVRKM